MATPPKGKPPAVSKRGRAPAEDAEPKDASGVKPTAENNKAKVVNKTAAPPKGDKTNPPKPDISKTHEYLDSVKPGEIRSESVKLIEEMKQARASGDISRVTQLKDALAGLKDKANAAGLGPKDVPELADASTLIQIAEAMLGGRWRSPSVKPPARTGPAPATGQKGAYSVNRGKTGACIVGTYEQIKNRCGTGQQAHHIVPDTLARTSNRAAGVKGLGRIPGMASFGGGPSICLQGVSGTPGSEHNTAHQCDAEICSAGNRTDNGLPGTIPVKEAIPIAMKHAIAARPDCKEQIETEVRKAYPNHEDDKRPMNSGGRPPDDRVKGYLDRGGKSDDNSMGSKPRRMRGR